MPADSPVRALDGAKARRIVEATRACVADHGIAGATFDRVAAAAGVSRGLLHYYFGTKERLLAEVVRRDCDERMALIAAALEGARSADDLLTSLVGTLEDVLDDDPGFFTLLYELFVAGRRTPEIAAELAGLLARTRDAVAAGLDRKASEGVVALGGPSEQVAEVLFSLADGIAIRLLTYEDVDRRALIATALVSARALVTAP